MTVIPKTRETMYIPNCSAAHEVSIEHNVASTLRTSNVIESMVIDLLRLHFSYFRPNLQRARLEVHWGAGLKYPSII